MNCLYKFKQSFAIALQTNQIGIEGDQPASQKAQDLPTPQKYRS